MHGIRLCVDPSQLPPGVSFRKCKSKRKDLRHCGDSAESQASLASSHNTNLSERKTEPKGPTAVTGAQPLKAKKGPGALVFNADQNVLDPHEDKIKACEHGGYRATGRGLV